MKSLNEAKGHEIATPRFMTSHFTTRSPFSRRYLEWSEYPDIYPGKSVRCCVLRRRCARTRRSDCEEEKDQRRARRVKASDTDGAKSFLSGCCIRCHGIARHRLLPSAHSFLPFLYDCCGAATFSACLPSSRPTSSSAAHGWRWRQGGDLG